LVDDMKSQAQAGGVGTGVALLKWVEQGRHVLARDDRPLIVDGNQGFLVLVPELDVNGRISRSILERVGDEIHNDLLDAIGIPGTLDAVLGKDQLDPARMADIELVDGLPDGTAQI